MQAIIIFPRTKEMQHAMHHHLPSLLPIPEEEEPAQGMNDFRFNIQLKNTEDISYAFSLLYL